ncbi:MAG: acyl-CoA thioesterase [Bacteroidetes bacterium]|jgi:acyl-CoA hydrolase|nr:acyl-CoA thioesterase [Bacteroidota bacterium]MBX7128763.1 acyl-CoA thioesterase [Flavobacteriales bacterium]MCC6653560.1 acyl-CoA thioesterase [Flavobacteriales bacterium]HMU15171.1 acyl-CoA thioesterase [Flavobacteriales bacterium]HMW97260.1 acyl-CoA thioesterase [Flavobacteriales bacterium]
MEPRPASAGYAETTHIVLPNETNTMGNLFGGQLLKWLDISCAISAHRHSRRLAVTVAVNHVGFDQPIRLGDFVTIKSHVSRTFSTSMEIWADVWVEDQHTGASKLATSAIYTFVAVDDQGKPVAVPEVVPVTEEEVRRYAGALRRRQLRLILSGRMQPKDATELKALFT